MAGPIQFQQPPDFLNHLINLISNYLGQFYGGWGDSESSWGDLLNYITAHRNEQGFAGAYQEAVHPTSIQDQGRSACKRCGRIPDQGPAADLFSREDRWQALL